MKTVHYEFTERNILKPSGKIMADLYIQLLAEIGYMSLFVLCASHHVV